MVRGGANIINAVLFHTLSCCSFTRFNLEGVVSLTHSIACCRVMQIVTSLLLCLAFGRPLVYSELKALFSALNMPLFRHTSFVLVVHCCARAYECSEYMDLPFFIFCFL